MVFRGFFESSVDRQTHAWLSEYVSACPFLYSSLFLKLIYNLIYWSICSCDTLSRSWTEHAELCSREWSSWFRASLMRKWPRSSYTQMMTSTTFSSDTRGEFNQTALVSQKEILVCVFWLLPRSLVLVSFCFSGLARSRAQFKRWLSRYH